jgi:hypothetical protein
MSGVKAKRMFNSDGKSTGIMPISTDRKKESRNVFMFHRESGSSRTNPAKYAEIPMHDSMIIIEAISFLTVQTSFFEKQLVLFIILATIKTLADIKRV